MSQDTHIKTREQVEYPDNPTVVKGEHKNGFIDLTEHKGLIWNRLFGEGDPYSSIRWEKRTAKITKQSGEVVFEQNDVEVPDFWSQTATDIVASKYFRGRLGFPEREWSARQMVDRVANTIAQWGLKDGYFAAEEDYKNFRDDLCYLLINQISAFNSPVWFNVGVYERPQCSACFILSVEDSMKSILEWYRQEGMIFKLGSGTGINLSTLRASKEKLSKGGFSSGPVSFMKGADGVANSIKSGGTTRRAAKMVVLNADHPDIKSFIYCKKEIENMAKILEKAGVKSSIEGELFNPYTILPFQNANNSVRVTDEFMKAVENDDWWDLKAVTTGETLERIKAREIMQWAADAAWHSADPGMQYDTTINDWHTLTNTGRINSSNPCSEYMSIDDSACNLSSINLLKFLKSDGRFNVDLFKKAVDIMITAQDIIVSNSSYPTEKITRNAERFRQLGLGYANLGALLMTLGLPYDSDNGRAVSGAITSLMTGRAYLQSAKIAKFKGPFDGYAENKEPMLRVLEKHLNSAQKFCGDVYEKQLTDDDELAKEAREVWNETLELARQYGVRNSQATVLAPTGCLAGDSLVLTDRGLVRLQGLGDPNGEKWQPLNIKVATNEEPRQATKFFVNGMEPVVTVTTKRGYRVRGTTTHKIRIVDDKGNWQWRRFADLKNGERVPLMLGGMIGKPQNVPLPPFPEAYWTSDHKAFVPRNMNPDLAEVVGYFMGDGSLHSKGLRFCVTNGDYEVIERLANLGRKLFGLEAKISLRQGYTEVALNSVRLTLWWEACGFVKRPPTANHWGKGYEGHIPDSVLYSNDPAIYQSFVRGLFEADGTAHNGYVAWSTVSERFSRDIQTLLLVLGFVTTHKIDQPYFGRKGQNPIHIIRLLNVNTGARFLKEIGFISGRKRDALEVGNHPQAARFDLVPIDRITVDRLAPDNDNLRKTMLLSLSRHGMVTRRSADILYERTRDLELTQALNYFYDEISAVELGEEQMTYDISVPSNVTYVANGFIGHNTIAFLMDCATTGVEPELALVKYKKLVGGGMLKLVNNQVGAALLRLGYNESEIREIINFILEKETIEEAPGLKTEHLPVFDCSFRPVNGQRSIHYTGHLRMMGAVQPFISGAISKTVNLPRDATVEEIYNAFIEAWKLGIKAVAFYRDGCKTVQPLSTKKDQLVERINGYTRIKLPEERPSVTHKFSVAGHEGYLTVGLYPETKKPGETFITIAKEGSTISGLFDVIATLISVSLQSGVPLKTLVKKFKDLRFEPSGATSNNEIPFAKSIIDYIFKYIGTRFLPEDEREEIFGAGHELGNGGEKNPKAQVVSAGNPAVMQVADSDSPVCECGTIMIKIGACYSCPNCFATTGVCN